MNFAILIHYFELEEKMVNRNQWSCLVNKQGDVLEWEDKAGAEYLAKLQQVCLYAQALLNSDRSDLHFYYCLENNHWLQISLTQYKNFTLIQAENKNLPFELSKREIELLTLISSGLSNEEIANVLSISKRTVDKHIENIFAKTNIESKTLLAIFAITENLICLPTPGNLENSILATFKIEQIAKQFETQKQAVEFTEKNVFSINSSHHRTNYYWCALC